MTQPAAQATPQSPSPAIPHPDFSAVAVEPPAESLAHESELLEHIAHEHEFPDRPSEHPVDEQLEGLMDPATLRAEIEQA